MVAFSMDLLSDFTLADGDIVAIQNSSSSELEKMVGIFRTANDPNDYYEISLMAATKLVKDVLQNDDSDFLEGGVDDGITVIDYLKGAPLSLSRRKKWYQTRSTYLDENEQTNSILQKLNSAGLAFDDLLEEGVKYLSTGQIIKLLFAKAVTNPKRLLFVYNPFTGIDTKSKVVLRNILSQISSSITDSQGLPKSLVLFFDSSYIIPSFVNKLIVCEGTKLLYEGKPNLWQDNSSPHEVHSLFPLQSKKTTTVKATPLIEMNNICVSYNQKVVLKNFNLTICENEHTLLQGPNGCGKTTLLELITGENPKLFLNEIYLFGKRRGSGESIWDIKKEMGIVSYHLHLEYSRLFSVTALEVVLSGLQDTIGIYKAATSSQMKLAKRWLEWGGFSDRGCRPFSEFSYGEQRQLLILRAMIKEPKLLILDEPCQGLDRMAKETCLELFEEICKSGATTIIYATHEQNEILKCTKQIIDFYQIKN